MDNPPVTLKCKIIKVSQQNEEVLHFCIWVGPGKTKDTRSGT